MKYIKDKVNNIIIDLISIEGYFSEIEKSVTDNKHENMDLYN